jgi:modulator of FtsH protease
MSAYTAAAWHDFFMAAVGASAALLGLLFVSLSINIQTILKYPYLPGRAAATLGILLVVLVVCFFGLAPNESTTTFGWVTVAVSSVSAAQTLWTSERRRRSGDRLTWTLGSLAQLLLPVLAIFGGGVSLLAGGGGGIYWILVGTALVFISASINAWVLLVEILR